jgi:hypothetical protein
VPVSLSKGNSSSNDQDDEHNAVPREDAQQGGQSRSYFRCDDGFVLIGQNSRSHIAREFYGIARPNRALIGVNSRASCSMGGYARQRRANARRVASPPNPERR